MRIALFINSLQGGGAERQMAGMANLFSKHGHDVSMVTFNDVSDDYSLHADVKRVRLGEHKSRLARWMDICLFFRRWDGDAVICFFPAVTRMAVVSNLFKRRKYTLIAGERINTDGQPVKKERRQKKWMYGHVDYVVSNSIAQDKHLKEIFPEYEDKFVAIHNYMNLSAYHVTPLPGSDVIRIGIFAHYREQKNGERFARAVKMVKESTDVRFVVEWYGRYMFSSSEYYKPYPLMKQYVEDNNLDDVLKLSGRTDDVAGMMLNCDAVCMPSLSEGFCNAISEGICCGRPVLASRVADNPIMVHNGENGFLFDPTDESDICGAILKFLKLTDGERKKMGQRSRQIAEELFVEEKFVNDYLKLVK